MLDVNRWADVARKHPWKTLEAGNLRSTVARLSYAALFVPKAYQGNGNGGADQSSAARYGVTLLLPPGDTAAALNDALRAVIKQEFGERATISAPTPGPKPTVRVDYVGGDGKPARANLNWPVVDQGEVLSDGYTAGSLFVAAYSYDKPPVVDAACNPVADQNSVYSGCYAFVTIRPYWAKNWNRLAIGLQGVQKLVDGERFGGGAPSITQQFDDVSSDFGAIAADAAAGLLD